MSDPCPGLAEVTVVILAGGQGTRLRPVVPDRPKVVADIDARPFLHYLLDYVAAAGGREVLICTGYKADEVEACLDTEHGPLRLTFSREETPLDTGGALRLALPHMHSDPVVVLNGDSFINVDFDAYLAWFFAGNRSDSLLLTAVDDTSRYGRVSLDRDGRISGFREKGDDRGPGLINAGVYILRKSTIAAIPEGAPFSLEKELFPALADNTLSGFPVREKFIDIGTPESYARAKSFFASLNRGA